MRIQSILSEPIHSIPYLQAMPSGKTGYAQLPILEARVEHLPMPLEAIVCTGDLQGIGTFQGSQEPRLLGEVLAKELQVLLETLGISPLQTGIVLSGDFYSSPQADERGASGDVRRVWDAFLHRFRWVAGILGNHDQFGSTFDDFQAFIRKPNLYYLDGESHSVDDLILAGIGGIIGKPNKPLRRSPDEYLNMMEKLKRDNPALIILHQSPALEKFHCPGSEVLGAAYEHKIYPLTICGHVSWPSPFVELDNRTQILNVDSRAILLRSPNSCYPTATGKD